METRRGECPVYMHGFSFRLADRIAWNHNTVESVHFMKADSLVGFYELVVYSMAVIQRECITQQRE
jgi:hypothetical protein